MFQLNEVIMPHGSFQRILQMLDQFSVARSGRMLYPVVGEFLLPGERGRIALGHDR